MGRLGGRLAARSSTSDPEGMRAREKYFWQSRDRPGGGALPARSRISREFRTCACWSCCCGSWVVESGFDDRPATQGSGLMVPFFKDDQLPAGRVSASWS
ncbi:MAG: hypothetical protein MZW92_43965 [Comamonadaceae bacterium]|nr:hypothetical protein [Comamonadaceae bacterium]